MNYPRPIPLTGDTTSAKTRKAEPDGWRFGEEERKSFYDILYSRRDVRRFRPDDIGAELLQKVLAAGHAAPSVGHSQPWRFIVVRDDNLRARAAQLAAKERLAQASKLDEIKRRQMLDFQLEGIAEAPIGIVVCCDRRVSHEKVLGRATYIDADMWSCAAAIENMWLAARAEGLGLGWVTLFQSKDLADLLSIPDGVENLGWLCLGWPDERNPFPGLERHGWSKKLDLDQLVFFDSWENTTDRPLSSVVAPVGSSIVDVRDDTDELLYVPGSLGILDKSMDRLAHYGIDGTEKATMALVACDHPVTMHQISAYQINVTRDVFEAAARAESLGAAFTAQASVGLLLVDVGVEGKQTQNSLLLRASHERGDLLRSDALSIADAINFYNFGIDVAKKIITESKVLLLGEVGMGNTTVAAALTSVLLDLEGFQCIGQGSAADYAIASKKIATVNRIKERVFSEVQDLASADPILVAAKAGGPDIAFMLGLIFEFSRLNGVVMLDGYLTSVAALLATRLDALVATHLLASHRSKEPAHKLILDNLGLEPLFDFRMRAGEGIGAVLAWQMLALSLRARANTARVEEYYGDFR